MKSLLLLLQLMVGSAEYQCSCVRYVTQNNCRSTLIFGLSAGLGLLLIIVIIIVSRCLRQSKPPGQGVSGKSMDKYKADKQCTRDLSYIDKVGDSSL